jgi:hypothetical protein
MKPIHVLATFTMFGLSATLLSCNGAEPVVAVPTVSTPPAAVATSPTEPKPLLDGTFSSMKKIAGRGEAIGVEITVSNSQGAALVTFQCAQGELPQPQQVAAGISGTTVHFKTRTNAQCPAATYSATIADDIMTLSQDGVTASPEVLKRVSKPGERPNSSRR